MTDLPGSRGVESRRAWIPPNAPFESSAMVSPGAACSDDACDDGVDRGHRLGGFADLACELVDVEALALGDVRATERGEEHAIGGAECRGVFVLMQRTGRPCADRGSKTAKSRPFGSRELSARSVSSTAVG